MIKGGGKLTRGVVTHVRGGGAAAITGREVVEVGTYAVGRELLTKPVLKGQVKGAVAAHSAGYVYDYFSKSPGSSASSYQQHGGPGGIPTYSSIDSVPTGSKLQKPKWVAEKGWNPGGKRGRHVCKKGWKLVRVGGAYRCMKPPL